MNVNPRIENVGAGAGQVYKQIDTSETNQLRTVKAGSGVVVTNNANDVEIAAAGSGVTGVADIPVLNDAFTDAAAKPFWTNTEMFTSADWQFSAANDRLEGIAENNQSDWYRQGIEGDADHAFKFTLNAATSIGIWFLGNSITVSLKYINSTNQFEFDATGKTDIDLPATPNDPFWIRLVRVNDDFYAYWRQNDTDPWILIGTHSNLNLEHDMTAELDSANGAYVHRAILYDNSFNGSATKAKFVKEIPLTDAATIAVDASLGNLFTVTIAGNRTLGAPTNPKQGQMIVFRITQGVGGSHTLGYNAIYRFSTDIPSPTLSTGAGDVDYLGFIYNEADTKWDCIGKVFGF
jgi:hypothetical protein